MYGAYRVVLKMIQGFTNGDGWTPAKIAFSLANLVNDRLPRDARLKEEDFEKGTKWSNWRDGDEVRYWIERGWPTACISMGGFLPASANEISTLLSEDERRLITPVLFDSDSARHATAKVLSGAKRARSHAELCDVLADSGVFSRQRELAVLPAFTRFADAAMDAMWKLWREISHDGMDQAPMAQSLTRSAELRLRLDFLRKAGDIWLRAPGRDGFPHDHTVTSLAESMRNATTPAAQLRALSHHHYKYGGGRRWFHEQSGRMVPLVPDSGIATANYGFRLLPLSRLAAQCGVANMNAVLDILESQNFKDEEEGSL
jgi:hypothetical protein